MIYVSGIFGESVPKVQKRTFGTLTVYRKRYVYDKGQRAFIQLFYMIAKKTRLSPPKRKNDRV
jgi:hypothetical protein